MLFQLSSDKTPAGDQPGAIRALTEGMKSGKRHQTLFGVTGSGKTFTVANVIANIEKPTLVIAHNKTLAAQLTQEYREFFPNNAVHYFVSYYDYYQPEAYVPTSDTYIEKEAQINAEIDRLRHATTQSLITRKDVIVVASVSAIYGLGSPVEYEKVHIHIKKGKKLTREEFIKRAISIQFERTNGDLTPGGFRVKGQIVDIVPTNEEVIYRIFFSSDKVEKLSKINALTHEMEEEDVDDYFLFPAKHFVVDKKEREIVLKEIEKELKDRLDELERLGKNLERERLRRRTLQDLSLIREIGYCTGIENYSRHFDRRKENEPPHTLLSYFPRKKDGTADFLTVIDESHVTVPQIEGMQAGDRSRKLTLIDHGFRLPSAKDNRPLSFEEFNGRVGQIIYTSATPSKYERGVSGENIVEQIIRPNGLLDPIIDVHPITGSKGKKGQVHDFIDEAKKEVEMKNRVLVTTLTKKTAEELSEYLTEAGIKAKYLHSDVKTIDRVLLLTEFRKGVFDVLVGVNLLREGLDLPEVTLVGILDADKEGFLRSETSLVQTIGRVARNSNGRVVLYADNMTGSLESAIEETRRRRKIQEEYNKKHNITPKTIEKNIQDITDEITKLHKKTVDSLISVDLQAIKKGGVEKLLKERRRKMESAVQNLDFETAAIIRDEIKAINEKMDKINKENGNKTK